MKRRSLIIYLASAAALPLCLTGCKGEPKAGDVETPPSPANISERAKTNASTYGSTKHPNSPANISGDIKIADLLDFDSHNTLSPLETCHQDKLYPYKENMIIDCFSEDMTDYNDYEEGDVLEREPYRSSKAGSFFRKQGFRPFLSETKTEIDLDNAYYKKSQADKNLPQPYDANFARMMRPEGCELSVKVFEAGENSPLWKDVPKKTVFYEDADKGKQPISWPSEKKYLVAMTPSSECRK